MKSHFKLYVLSVLLYLSYVKSAPLEDDQYQIGTGIADITGPAAEINMMGYAKFGQDSDGIHMRLYSRAAVVVDKSGNRICYVTTETCGATQIVKLEVVKALQAKYKDLYSHDNVLISATHTHSGPGGYFQYLLYIITTEGFITDSFQAMVNGVVKSIDMAHNNLKPGHIFWNEGELLDTSVNRSPASYENNPKEERDKYKYNTDKSVSILKFVDQNDTPLGLINWHAVHGTSMNNSNKLISSDNKGLASQLMEADFNVGQLPGKGPFVAIFSQPNEGDASPNTQGAKCIDTGLPCDFYNSTCNGTNDLCIAFGPGKDMYESTEIIANKQYMKAMEMFNSSETKISGKIDFIYQNINMSEYEVKLPSNETIKTCSPALGYSFAAGTTDGEGATMFHQGTHTGEEPPFWDWVRNLLKEPSDEITECHKPKAILVPVGEMKIPYQWAPEILPTQLLRIGDIVIAGLPAEFTTMSGRRLRDAVTKAFADNGQTVKVVIAGLANTYSNYVTTYEEYQMQRYEGGSTMFGPHTLQAYIQQYVLLANSMAKKTKVAPGPQFPNLLNDEITLKPGVIFDNSGPTHDFGDIIRNADPVYKMGSLVHVVFVGAHPRNDLKTDSTYLTVERLNPKNDTDWEVVATDANWETKFIWRRMDELLGTSHVEIKWNIPLNAPTGKYRIRYFGDHKSLLGDITPFIGTTKTFEVDSHLSHFLF